MPVAWRRQAHRIIHWPMTAVLNFAYGSNMLWQRIRERVPSAVPLGPVRLLGYQLHWHKVGKDRSGKCDIRPAADPASLVHGVLYRFHHSDKHLLNTAEGLGFGYDEIEVRVETAQGPLLALAYAATHIEPALRPFDWYQALVVAGAVEHGLPVDYVDALRRIEAQADADTARAALHFKLAGQG